MLGEGAPVLIRRAFEAAGLGSPPAGALDAFLAIYGERLLIHTRPYAGIPEVLAALAEEHSLAVLTNKPARPARAVLDGLALSRFFRTIVGGDGPLGKKPDPSGLLDLVREAEATPGATLMVGDSAIDLETARRAGTRVCLARYGFGFRFRPEDLQAHELVIDQPADLPGLLRGASLGDTAN